MPPPDMRSGPPQGPAPEIRTATKQTDLTGKDTPTFRQFAEVARHTAHAYGCRCRAEAVIVKGRLELEHADWCPAPPPLSRWTSPAVAAPPATEDDEDQRYAWRVVWRRDTWNRDSTRIFEIESAARRLVDKLRGDGRPDLAPLETLRLERRIVDEWQEVQP